MTTKPNGQAGAISLGKSPQEKCAYVTDALLRAGFAAHQFDNWSDADFAACFKSMTSGIIAEAGRVLAAAEVTRR
jgi:hypothetical protein